MKVLVTGSGGFIGCNLCKALLARGIDVVASFRSSEPLFVRDLTSKEKSCLTLSKGDLNDQSYIQTLYGQGIDSVINSAIITSPACSEVDFFIPMTRTNLTTTLNQLEFALHEKIKNYIYVSSFSVYGCKNFSQGEKVFETRPLDLHGTYSITKRSCELLSERFGELSEAKVACGRLATPYGPYERVTHSRTLMGTIYGMVKAAQEGRAVRVGAKGVERDWTYVDDTVEGLLALLLAAPNQLHFTEYNISSAISSTNEDIAKMVQLLCPNFRYSFVEDGADADVSVTPPFPRGIADISRLMADTGFHVINTLEDGIGKYMKHLACHEF